MALGKKHEMSQVDVKLGVVGLGFKGGVEHAYLIRELNP